MPPDTALILAFDTSAAHCAVALLRGDDVLSESVEEMARGQAERLMPLLEETLAEAGAGWADLAALAPCVGPGNFTGTRITVSAARGLALGLGIPAIGISALEAQASDIGGEVLSSLDARRERIYLQRFLDGKAIDEPALTTIEDIAGTRTTNDLRVIGDRSSEIAEALGINVRNALPRPDPTAIPLARCAVGRLPTAGGRPKPLYIRQADAAPSSDIAPLILDDA